MYKSGRRRTNVAIEDQSSNLLELGLILRRRLGKAVAESCEENKKVLKDESNSRPYVAEISVVEPVLDTDPNSGDYARETDCEGRKQPNSAASQGGVITKAETLQVSPRDGVDPVKQKVQSVSDAFLAADELVSPALGDIAV